eukprot:16371981-Heterocapsa_arctica.AAC.1
MRCALSHRCPNIIGSHIISARQRVGARPAHVGLLQNMDAVCCVVRNSILPPEFSVFRELV